MDERIRCSYCLQELNDMKDPRQLTCTHIFCMSCIRSDCKQEGAVKCPICGKATDEVDLDTLDKPSENKLSRKPEVQVTEYKCNRCEDNTTAVSYCLECADLICDKHLQIHQDYFKTSHTVIDVLTYATNAAAYHQTPCSQHKSSNVSNVCSKCHLLVCPECNPPRECSEGHDAEDHQFHTLSRIAEDFKKEFDELLKGCTDKVTEICMLEKETWLTLDSVIEKCQKMVADVQKRTEEQISQIRRSSRQLIQQIHDYQVDRTNRVQVFVSDLLMKREGLEQLQKSVRDLVQNCSIEEKVQQKNGKTSALKDGREMEIKKCNWEEMALIGFATQQKSELCLKHLPSSINHSRCDRVVWLGYCQSVCFTSDGELMVASDGQVHQYSYGTMEKVTTKDMGGKILSLAARGPGEMVSLLANGDLNMLGRSYSQTTIANVPKATRIAFCQHNFQFWSLTNRCLVRRLGEKQVMWSVTKQELVSICCHPDGNLLAVSKQSGVLYKFGVDEGKQVLEQIWSCNELPGAYAVCTDKSGWIYVAGNGGKIYIVSEGMIRRCLESDKLTECEDPAYGDIAVYDDTLVAIEHRSGNINTFSLK